MDKRIQSIEHDIDGWWIYLKPGFILDGVHQIHTNSKKEALSWMKSVDPCDCDECEQMIAARDERES